MSWKLTKKLKETHLGPLTSTFSRSPSTSTIVGDDKGQASSTIAAPSSSSTTPANDNTIGTPLPLSLSCFIPILLRPIEPQTSR